MNLEMKLKIGDVVGYLYKEKLGYTYKIKGYHKNKIELLGRSYVYLSDKRYATEKMRQEMETILDLQKLFN